MQSIQNGNEQGKNLATGVINKLKQAGISPLYQN